MAKAKEATLYQLVDGQYQRVVKGSNGRYSTVDGHTFYLRYIKDGSRRWEAVGLDLSFALDEQKARQSMLDTVQLAPADTRKSLEAAIRSYLKKHLLATSIKSNRRTKWLLDQFSAVVKKHYLDEVNADTLNFFAAWLQNDHKSPKTIRDRISSLKTFLHSEGLPRIEGLKLPKVHKRTNHCYTRAEVDKMLLVANPEERFLIQFLLAFGVREQECAHTEWEDIRAEHLYVTFKPGCRCSCCGEAGFTTKTCKERAIPIPDWFAPILEARRGKGLLFKNSLGKPEGHILAILKKVGLRARINCGRCVAESGYTCVTHACCCQVTTHKWRRTFATWLHVLGGVSIPILQEWLGHADDEDASTTMRYICKTEIIPGWNKERSGQAWSGFNPTPKSLGIGAVA
jgi:integrase